MSKHDQVPGMEIYGADDTGNRYTVESDSGSVYTVSFAGSPDENVDTWSCDCQAGRRGRDCRHIKAFIAWRASYCQVCNEWRQETVCRCAADPEMREWANRMAATA